MTEYNLHCFVSIFHMRRRLRMNTKADLMLYIRALIKRGLRLLIVTHRRYFYEFRMSTKNRICYAFAPGWVFIHMYVFASVIPS